jgi:hypothetical protein
MARGFETYTITYTDGTYDVFDVTTAKVLAKARPLTTINVTHELGKSGKPAINKAHVMRTNLRQPVITATTPAGRMVIDGWHRLMKANRLKVKTLPAKALTPTQSKNLSSWPRGKKPKA